MINFFNDLPVYPFFVATFSCPLKIVSQEDFSCMDGGRGGVCPGSSIPVYSN